MPSLTCKFGKSDGGGRILLSVSCWLYTCTFEHEHDRLFRCSRAMLYAMWNCEPLVWFEFDCLVFKIDEEFTGDNIEEYVFIVVIMPMKFALHDTNPYDAIVD